MDQSFEDFGHSVLQKLIIVFLGLLMATVILSSCTSTKSCAAYSDVKTEITD